MNSQFKFVIFVTGVGNIPSPEPGDQHHLIIIHSLSGIEKRIVAEDQQSAIGIINQLACEPSTKNILFISGEDEIDLQALHTVVQDFYSNTPNCHFSLFLPYKDPPSVFLEKSGTSNYGQREDGFVKSFLVSAMCFDGIAFCEHFNNWSRLVYELLFPYLNSQESNNVEIFQVGKKEAATEQKSIDSNLLGQSLIIIPHKDSVSLLARCLHHLNQVENLPAEINLCFDDDGYSQFDAGQYSNLENLTKVYVNTPGNVGPYPARHYSILETDKDYIFFQDSDDIPIAGRFEKQLVALQKRGLDMIGSHELRIDQFAQALVIIRYPLDVSASLDKQNFHPLFHPTALITKSAYFKTGGFSTNLRFGYDSQFLLRAHFFLKIGNIDDFLYLRFKRPNSLTTDPKTSIGSNQRSFLIHRWLTDFMLVQEDKLKLGDSSLAVKKHTFPFKLKEYNNIEDRVLTPNKTTAATSKETYGLVCRTIISVLDTEDVNFEKATTFSLYMYWAVIMAYSNSLSVKKQLAADILQRVKEQYPNKNTDENVQALKMFFLQNKENLLHIYRNSNASVASPMLQYEDWQHHCSSLFLHNASLDTCFQIFFVLHECLRLSAQEQLTLAYIINEILIYDNAGVEHEYAGH